MLDSDISLLGFGRGDHGWNVSGAIKTGPSKAHSGNYFMYLKPSSFGNQGDKSYLTSPKLPAGTSSMSFYYHMYGKDIGSLAVEAKIGGKWSNGHWILHTHNKTTDTVHALLAYCTRGAACVTDR